MPGLEPGPEGAVENACLGLKHEVGSRLRPSHPLFLRKALAHDRVDHGFDERGRHPLPVAMALVVVRDGMGIVGNVGLELADAFAERLDARVPRLYAFKVHGKVVDAGKGRTDVAVPQGTTNMLGLGQSLFRLRRIPSRFKECMPAMPRKMVRLGIVPQAAWIRDLLSVKVGQPLHARRA